MLTLPRKSVKLLYYQTTSVDHYRKGTAVDTPTDDRRPSILLFLGHAASDHVHRHADDGDAYEEGILYEDDSEPIAAIIPGVTYMGIQLSVDMADALARLEDIAEELLELSSWEPEPTTTPLSSRPIVGSIIAAKMTKQKLDRWLDDLHFDFN